MSTTDSQHEEHADGIVEDREQAPPVYFTVLFYGLIIWGVAFMAFYLLSGWSSDSEFQAKMAAHNGEPVAEQQAAAPTPATPAAPAPEPAKEAVAPAVAASGADLYKKHCAGCHGADGKGGFGPDLSAAEYQYGKSPEAVTESILAGRPGNMPAFEQKLSPEETTALTDFVLSL